jgi:hypothetical protein
MPANIGRAAVSMEIECLLWKTKQVKYADGTLYVCWSLF